MSFMCLGDKFTGFDCSLLWICMTLLFFIAAFYKKWVAEGMGVEYNMIISVAFAEISFIVVALIFGSIQWALGAGVIGIVVGGWLGAKFVGGSEGSEFD